MSFVEFKNIYKTYKNGDSEINANDNISFEINEAEFCVIVGASGAGKTTLLNLLGGMERATSGQIFVDGKEITSLNEKELNKYRRYDVGFVFQFYNLMPNLTVLENIEIAKELSKSPLNPVEVLDNVGLKERINHFPSQLSGGEQQRVSIARAIAKNSKILLCDEPTGALDYVTGKKILKLLHDTCKEMKKTTIIITHNHALTKIADRIITVKSGKIVDNYINDNPLNIEEVDW